jgi:2C-methyl-D-erythritol 2,4-cyclodiphosphate synthase
MTSTGSPPATASTICGVRIAHDQSLEGHSDADVGLHALTDAILGTIGAGDLGSHFPPGDPQWRGADSARFLSHAAGLVAAKGGRIAHVDVTLICERPKIAPHRAAHDCPDCRHPRPRRRPRQRQGDHDGRLGFTGRREGIAAQAVATVALPGCMSYGGEITAAAVAFSMPIARPVLRIVTAESCTGGLIAACLTEIAGCPMWWNAGSSTPIRTSPKSNCCRCRRKRSRSTAPSVRMSPEPWPKGRWLIPMPTWRWP